MCIRDRDEELSPYLFLVPSPRLRLLFQPPQLAPIWQRSLSTRAVHPATLLQSNRFETSTRIEGFASEAPPLTTEAQSSTSAVTSVWTPALAHNSSRSTRPWSWPTVAFRDPPRQSC